MNKFLGHFLTITAHRNKVIYHCFKAGIPFQGLLHDLSKYSPSEFFKGVKYFQGTRSPNEGEREQKGYSEAWMHHKGRNKHHFEYWTDYTAEPKTMSPVKMPFNYVVEMFCDRVAASKIYMKESYTDQAPLEYFEKGRAIRLIHNDTSRLIEEFLTVLSKEGEAAAFKYIKEYDKTKY